MAGRTGSATQPAGAVPRFAFCKGLAAYRGGDWAAAARWFTAAGNARPSPPLDGAAQAYLAMVLYQEQKPAAFDALNEARRMAEEGPSLEKDGDLTESFENWVICRIALREAVKVVEGVDEPH